MLSTCSSTHGSWLAVALCLCTIDAAAQPAYVGPMQRAPDNPYALTSEENPYEAAAANAESPYAQGLPVADDGTASADATDDPDEYAKVRVHSFGVGLASTSIATEDTMGLGFLGPGVSHEYFIGRKWGFLSRLAFSFPLSGRVVIRNQNLDERVGLRPYYTDRRFEADGMLMAARRFVLGSDFELLAGVGVHVHTIRIVGPKYLPIDGISGGFAGLVRLDYSVNDSFALGADFSLGIDPLDFVDHLNRMVIVIPASLSFHVSVRR